MNTDSRLTELIKAASIGEKARSAGIAATTGMGVAATLALMHAHNKRKVRNAYRLGAATHKNQHHYYNHAPAPTTSGHPYGSKTITRL